MSNTDVKILFLIIVLKWLQTTYIKSNSLLGDRCAPSEFPWLHCLYDIVMTSVLNEVWSPTILCEFLLWTLLFWALLPSSGRCSVTCDCIIRNQVAETAVERQRWLDWNRWAPDAETRTKSRTRSQEVTPVGNSGEQTQVRHERLNMKEKMDAKQKQILVLLTFL